MVDLAVLMPLPPDGPPSVPEALPHGRAALALAREGIRLVFTEHIGASLVRGFQARPKGWTPCATTVQAVYDAWPAGHGSLERTRALEAVGTRPVGNAPSFTESLADRLATLRALEVCGVPILPVEPNKDLFGRAFAHWGRAFAEPRRVGTGPVRWVYSAEELPHDDEWLLRRAVQPPRGWTRAIARVVVQRSIEGAWAVSPVVLSRMASTGQTIYDAASDLLPPATVRQMCELALRATEALVEDRWVLELEVVFTLDASFQPHLAEVCGAPRWDLLALDRAQTGRWTEAVQQTLCRPFRVLAGGS